MRKRTLARECALQILYQQEMNPQEPDQALAAFWDSQDNMSAETRGFTEELVRGTLGRLAELDQVIGKYCDNWQLGRMAAVDRNILRVAVFELLHLDIPPKVTINEAVNLAKKFSQLDSGKFVNGVLDKINHTEKPSVQKSS